MRNTGEPMNKISKGKLPKVETEPDGARVEYYPIPLTPGTLWENGPAKRLNLRTYREKEETELGSLVSLCRDLFCKHWKQIVFGPCIQGAVYELNLREKPKSVTYLDGYLTVVFPLGPAHFHLCIGPHKGLGHETKVSAKLSKERQCTLAAFYKRNNPGGCLPESYGIRLWNGKGEQMITFFLPGPYLSDKQRILKKPDWNRLDLWHQLREQYL